jgi:hypothetical protein
MTRFSHAASLSLGSCRRDGDVCQVGGKLGSRLADAGWKACLFGLLSPPLERGLEDGGANAGEQPRLRFGDAALLERACQGVGDRGELGSLALLQFGACVDNRTPFP